MEVPATHEILPFETDGGAGARARIGIVALASDHTIEYEFRRLLDLPGVAFYTTRIMNAPTITPKTLAAMEQGIADQARAILPGMDLDVIAYCCTSATTVLGENTVFSRLREGRPSIAPTTPLTAATAGMRALGAKRIAVLTPYERSVNAIVEQALAARGFEIPVFATFDEADDNAAGRITLGSVRQAVLKIGNRDDVDAVFVSCTNLRLAEAVPGLEDALGIPVTSSNHALAWHCLRLAGIDEALPHLGRLYRLPGGCEAKRAVAG